MFGFYYRAHELAIQRAAEKNDWDEVNKLYRIDPIKSKDSLDDAICDGVMNKVLFGNLRLDQLQNYLLRALTLIPSIIAKQELIFRLRDVPALIELEKECGLITILIGLSSEIYTVMRVRNYTYDNALEHVNKGKDIPSIAPLVDLLKTMTI